MTGATDFRLVNSAEQSSQSPPLVVDLDGTLVKTNLLLESLLALFKGKAEIHLCPAAVVAEGESLS